MAFTGHKSLLGPTGIGGLVLSRGLMFKPPGSAARESIPRNQSHTQTYPHRLEAGTINFLGVLGLMAGLD